MENSLYRSRVRTIGFMDLVIVSMGLIYILIVFILAMVFTESAIADNTLDTEEIQITSKLSFILWIITIIMALSAALQIFAAIKLIDGTQIGRDPMVAAKSARFWRNVTIIFLIISLFNIMGDGFVIEIVKWISISLHCIALYVVQKFIHEMDFAVVNGTLPKLRGDLDEIPGVHYKPFTEDGEEPYCPPPAYNQAQTKSSYEY